MILVLLFLVAYVWGAKALFWAILLILLLRD